MGDLLVARFFIETLTGKTILDIELKLQEFTFQQEARDAKDIETLRGIRKY